MYKHAIVIIHGYHLSSLSVIQVERIIKKIKLFDRVINIDLYNSLFQLNSKAYSVGTPMIRIDKKNLSTRHTIVEFALNQILPYMNDIDYVHFLTYSMGGLVARAIAKLNIKELPTIKSIVQLGTPNNGTDISRYRQNSLAESFNPTDQLDQMKKNSEFIHWLNSSPTLTNEIIHIGAIGEMNIGKIGGFDGLITFQEMKIDGLRMIYLGDLSKIIDHYNIVYWETGNKGVMLIRNSIIEFYQRLI